MFRIRILLCLCLFLTATLAPHLWPAPDSPILFRASFDNTLEAAGARGTVKPLMSEGRVEYRPGKTGQALLCGGDAANVKYPVEGNVRPSEGTVMMWVQAVDWPDDEKAFHVFFETEGPGWLVLYRFWTGGFLMLTGIDQGHYSSAFDEGYSIRNGEWHHLAGVWKRDRLEFYVDGVRRKKHGLPSLPQALTGGFWIGDRPWAKPHDSHTLIDEATVYRYALPEDQIAAAAKNKQVTFQPKAQIDLEPHPSKDQWRVAVDASGFVGEEGPGVSATVEVMGKGKTTARGTIEKFDAGQGVVALDISKVPSGQQMVRATIHDAAGKPVTRAEKTFEKPVEAPWARSRIGMEDRVLPPFTELRVGGVRAVEARKPRGNTVECWGRKYAMDGPFPTQIESAGLPMLAGPIHLSVATDSGEVKLQQATGHIGGWSPTRASHSGSASSPGLSLTTSSALEYDGMVWTEVTLVPRKPLAVTRLTLHIPMPSATALYLHNVRANWDEDNAGFLPPGGYESVNFQPYLWLGDDDRGLAWFAESQQGWSVAPGKVIQRVVRKGDTVEMQIDFINQPTTVEAPLKFSFGMQATPVKPLPGKSTGWRLGNLGTADNLKDPSMGNMQVVWCNGNLAHYGYPWPKGPEKFRKLVEDLHARKTLVLPYVNLNFMSSGAPEWSYYNPDWRDAGRSFSGGDVGEMGDDLIGACPHSEAWRDFIACKIAKFVEEFHVDGIYIDCWNPNPCVIEEHGCGWRDESGILRGRIPLRDMREIVRPVRAVFAERRPEFHLIIHMSADVVIPMLSFADSMLDGEQYQGVRDPKDDYLGVVPLDKWRAENSGGHWGVFPFFLPEFTPNKNRTDPLPTERLMGIMLAHGASPWPLWCKSEVVFDAWKALDKFGIVDAEFMPYWKPNGVTTDNKDFVVSVYRSEGRALLVVLNSGKADAEANLKIDPKSLKLKSILTARNGTDGSDLPTTANSLRLLLSGRSYRLVVLQ